MHSAKNRTAEAFKLMKPLGEWTLSRVWEEEAAYFSGEEKMNWCLICRQSKKTYTDPASCITWHRYLLSSKSELPVLQPLSVCISCI